MPITQSEIAQAWSVTRGLISRYVKRGMPLDSLWDAERWIGQNVYRNKIKFRASERENIYSTQVNLQSIPPAFALQKVSESQEQPSEGSGELHDPCPELPMATPADEVRKYIHWGLYFRGCPRSRAEWLANHLVEEIKCGRGDEPYPE